MYSWLPTFIVGKSHTCTYTHTHTHTRTHTRPILPTGHSFKYIHDSSLSISKVSSHFVFLFTHTCGMTIFNLNLCMYCTGTCMEM